MADGRVQRRQGGSVGRAGESAHLHYRELAEPFNPVRRGGPLTRPGSPPSRDEDVMFRISHRGEAIEDADTIDGAREIFRGQPSDRFDVDVIRSEPFPSGIRREIGVG